MNQTPFFVPESLLPYVDETLKEAHAELAGKELDEFWSEMPISYTPKNSSEAEYIDLTPRVEHDKDNVIVLPLPFANGWAPHMALRAKLLQTCMDEPRRIIILPNDRKSYHLTSEERSYVARGNFEPIVTKHLQTLQNLNVQEISYIGYSQGAALGASALRLAALRDQFELGSSGLFEPPNVLRRSPRELQRQFIATGKTLDKAVNDSGVPALSEAQHSRGGLDSVAKNFGLLPFVIKTQSATNRAIHKGFTQPYFFNDVIVALKRNKNLNISLAAGLESTITPPAMLRDDRSGVNSELVHRLRARFVEGYGHEMGDNIVVHAILGKLAIENR